MILFWRIRYLDTRDRRFKDRDLWLDTDELDPLTRIAVEACNELKQHASNYEMLKYRHLFKPENLPGEMHERLNRSGRFETFCLIDFFEDQDAKPLTRNEVAVALMGSEDAVMLPSGCQQHDIEYLIAEKVPIDISIIRLTQEQLRVLSYFTRDVRELIASTLFKEGPGTLSGVAVSPRPPMNIETSVTDEEIRSFVTIFRRLYMQNEPANLTKAAAVLIAAVGVHPYANWIAAGVAEIAGKLDRPPDFVPFAGNAKPTFTLKLLIDVFLYTQYAHQPDERRLRQFDECLRDIGGDRAVLTYFFLTELWSLGIQMRNVGVNIVQFFEVYSQFHQVSCDVVTSAGSAHPGIGTLEKKHEREDRILREKAEELAVAIWKEAGHPPGGHNQYFATALMQLKAAIGTNAQ